MILQGDCMEMVGKVKDNSVDLLLTDPPYTMPVITSFGREKFKNVADLSVQGFYFTELKKRIEPKLKKDSIAFIFCDDKFYPILFSAFYDWKNVGLIIWDKGRIGMGNPVRKRHELIFYAHNGVRPFRKHGEYTHLPSVLNFPPEKNTIHGAQKPKDLLKILISGFHAGGSVLDMFGGSGSTESACNDLGVDCVTFELNTDIFKSANNRILHELV